MDMVVDLKTPSRMYTLPTLNKVSPGIEALLEIEITRDYVEWHSDYVGE